MKVYAYLLLVTLVFPRASYSAGRYSLPGGCSIAVGLMQQPVQVERSEIIATTGSDGSLTSPFRVVGYDKECLKIFDRTFAGKGASTNQLCDAELAVPAEVRENLAICDSEYRLQAKKINGTYLVVVVELKGLLIDAVPESSVVSTNCHVWSRRAWPEMDGDRKFYYFKEVRDGAEQGSGGASSSTGGSRILSGALYLKDDAYSIRFELCRSVKNENKVIASGRVVGKIVGEDVVNEMIELDDAQNGVDVNVRILDEDEATNIDERGKAPLERVGLKHRTLRMTVLVDNVHMDLDMRIMTDWRRAFKKNR